MTNIFKIHPAIGISRLGDSTTDFCLSPEVPMGLPIKCDRQGRTLLDAAGQEQTVDTFKDAQGRIKRQAARFRVYVYEDANDQHGRELKIGDRVKVYKWQTGEFYTAILLDIEWTVYLANKKASWYQFKGTQPEYDYAPDHPLRNPAIKDATARQRLIIDPGPQTVSYSHSAPRQAEFAKDKNWAFPQSFPSTLTPKNIDTLGETLVTQQDDYNRLLVLGGHGRSGSYRPGYGETHIEINTSGDGWFDDISDGPVTANLWLQHLLDDGDSERDLSPFTVPVDDPAWVLVAYPGYVPAIDNMTTLDDVLYDLSLRKLGYNPEIYGPASDSAQPKDWNKNYYAYFYRDIWPILHRPNIYQWVMPFNESDNGDSGEWGSSLNLDVLAVPDYEGQDLAQRASNAAQRQYIFDVLCKPGHKARSDATLNYADSPLLIPLLFGDHPRKNSLASRALPLTDTQLFFLQQWVDGKFINEKNQPVKKTVKTLATPSGSDLDRSVLLNALGGAFAPNGEICWIIRNPLIYAKPYRIKHAPYEPGSLSQPAVVLNADTHSDLRLGLEPGDLTKYGVLPWQVDFSECASHDIDVTYEGWSKSYPVSETISTDVQKGLFWWSAHRPLQVFLPMRDPSVAKTGAVDGQAPWVRPTSQPQTGNLKAATAWAVLGFIHISADESLETGHQQSDGNLTPLEA